VLARRNKETNMMLKNKVAVIYGAGGSIGGAVAHAFAREGATVFLTGRKRAAVALVAKEIVSAGGAAETAEVDALDEQAVEKHLQSVIDKASRVDISFNAFGMPYEKILGVPLVEIDVEQFSQPIANYTKSYFLTARLAARRMAKNKSGVGRDHDRHRTPLADGYPIERRVWSGTGCHGGTYSRPILRTRYSGHSRSRSATTRHTGDKLNEGGLRHQGQADGHDLGTVPRIPRKYDPYTTGHDARGGSKHGGLHGFR
jgi:hypothetical protein